MKFRIPFESPRIAKQPGNVKTRVTKQ